MFQKLLLAQLCWKELKQYFWGSAHWHFSAEPNSCSAIYWASHANVYTHCRAHERPGKHTHTVDVCAPTHNTYCIMKPCLYSSLILEFNCCYKNQTHTRARTHTHTLQHYSWYLCHILRSCFPVLLQRCQHPFLAFWVVWWSYSMLSNHWSLSASHFLLASRVLYPVEDSRCIISLSFSETDVL